MEPHFYYALQRADHFLLRVEQEIYFRVPELLNYNRFEKFLLLNAVLLSLLILFKILALFSPTKIYNGAVGLAFRLPFVKKELASQLSKTKAEFLSTYP